MRLHHVPMFTRNIEQKAAQLAGLLESAEQRVLSRGCRVFESQFVEMTDGSLSIARNLWRKEPSGTTCERGAIYHLLF